MDAEAVPWIVNVYCCNGSVLHVVQIGCSKVWCQELFVWACCSHVCGDVLRRSGRWSVRTCRRRFVRYVTSEVYCCLYSFAGVFFGVTAFLFYKFVLRSGATRSYILLQPIIYIRSFIFYISEVWIVMRKIRFVVSKFSVYKRVVLRVLIFKIFRFGGPNVECSISVQNVFVFCHV